MKVEEFIEFLMNYVVNNYAESKLYTLTEEDIKNIGKLADEKY
ncbi:MAG TPA: lipoate--protein ligase, partial [Clostridiaceae bacterium]|nr:lipoate--protein ligase [Clostridiaceae bacterium]